MSGQPIQGSKAGRLRELLRQAYPNGLTAAEMAEATGWPSDLVSALMGWDIAHDRIAKRSSGAGLTYYWIDQRQLAISKARQFLESCGFEVRPA